MALFTIPTGGDADSKAFIEAYDKVTAKVEGNVTHIFTDESNGFDVKVYKAPEAKMIVLKTCWPDGYEEAVFAYDAVNDKAMNESYSLFVEMGKLLMTDPLLIDFMMMSVSTGYGGPRLTVFGKGKK